MTDADLNVQCVHAPGMCDDCLSGHVAKKLGRNSWHLPSYSTDISAAWEIVEHLGNCGITIRKADPTTKWFVSMFDWDKGNPNVGSEADTAPRAICEAFLKLP